MGKRRPLCLPTRRTEDSRSWLHGSTAPRRTPAHSGERGLAFGDEPHVGRAVAPPLPPHELRDVRTALRGEREAATAERSIFRKPRPTSLLSSRLRDVLRHLAENSGGGGGAPLAWRRDLHEHRTGVSFDTSGCRHTPPALRPACTRALCCPVSDGPARSSQACAHPDPS